MRIETRNSKSETRNSVQTVQAQSKSGIRDFKDLEVWKVSRELRQEIYKLAKSLPEFERYALANQLRRAAISVTANVAEGFGRFGYQENAQFCRQARGSLYELRDHLTTCVDAGYAPVAEGRRVDRIAQRATQVLNGYLRSTLALKSATERGGGKDSS
ncbi:MAG: four helix bundle protein [Terriglobia bacterium]